MTDAASWKTSTPKLIKRFTYVDRYDEVVDHYVEKDGLIGCPRAAFPVSDMDNRVEGPQIVMPVGAEFVARNNQQKFIDKAEKLLLGGESFVAQAPTGFGKTVIGCQLFRAVARPTLVIVPKEDLLDQWQDEIRKWLGTDPGTIQGDKWDIKPVTVAMIHTLAQRGVPDSIAKEFGFVLWDEVHRVGASTFSKTVFQFPAKLRMGLSATPRRLDGREQMIFDSIGPIRVVEEQAQLTPSVAVYKTEWECPRYANGRKVHAEIGKTMHLEKHMADDTKRNLLIMKLVKAAYDRGRRIVVFSSIKDHLRYLMDTVTGGMDGIPVDDTVLYISGLTKKQREKAKTKRVMFATWGMMGEGTDIEWLDTCILATPRANVDQAIGRILREFPGKKEPFVIDIQDWDAPAFEAYSKKRLKLYAEKGAPCKNYRI